MSTHIPTKPSGQTLKNFTLLQGLSVPRKFWIPLQIVFTFLIVWVQPRWILSGRGLPFINWILTPWAVKRVNPRKAKKICLKWGKSGIFLSWYAFLHLKSYLIKYMAKVQHDVVWAWLPLVNKSMYSVDEPYFNFKFRPKLPSDSGGLSSRVMTNKRKKGRAVCKAPGSEILP